MPFREFKTAVSERNERTVIVLSDGTEIDIYHLDIEPFWADSDKVQFYGDDHGDLLAFETDYRPEIMEEVTAALVWYAAVRLDFPQMELKIIDPRPLVN